MPLDPNGIVYRLVVEAINLGTDSLEIEYKDGHEEIFAVKGAVGQGIARLQSSSPEAESLRSQLHSISKRKQRLIVGDYEYELQCRIYDSFGEDAFRVRVRRV